MCNITLSSFVRWSSARVLICSWHKDQSFISFACNFKSCKKVGLLYGLHQNNRTQAVLVLKASYSLIIICSYHVTNEYFVLSTYNKNSKHMNIHQMKCRVHSSEEITRKKLHHCENSITC